MCGVTVRQNPDYRFKSLETYYCDNHPACCTLKGVFIRTSDSSKTASETAPVSPASPNSGRAASPPPSPSPSLSGPAMVALGGGGGKLVRRAKSVFGGESPSKPIGGGKHIQEKGAESVVGGESPPSNPIGGGQRIREQGVELVIRSKSRPSSPIGGGRHIREKGAESVVVSESPPSNPIGGGEHIQERGPVLVVAGESLLLPINPRGGGKHIQEKGAEPVVGSESPSNPIGGGEQPVKWASSVVGGGKPSNLISSSNPIGGHEQVRWAISVVGGEGASEPIGEGASEPIHESASKPIKVKKRVRWAEEVVGGESPPRNTIYARKRTKRAGSVAGGESASDLISSSDDSIVRGGAHLTYAESAEGQELSMSPGSRLKRALSGTAWSLRSNFAKLTIAPITRKTNFCIRLGFAYRCGHAVKMDPPVRGYACSKDPCSHSNTTHLISVPLQFPCAWTTKCSSEYVATRTTLYEYVDGDPPWRAILTEDKEIVYK